MREKPKGAEESFQEAKRTVTHAMADSDQAASHLKDAQRPPAYRCCQNERPHTYL